MTIGEEYTSEYLRATDLARVVQVTIDEVTLRTFQDPATAAESKKVVLSFVGAKKMLVLNKTQARATAQAVGSDELEDWPGKTIVLAPGMAPNGQATITVSPVTPAPDSEEMTF